MGFMSRRRQRSEGSGDGNPKFPQALAFLAQRQSSEAGWLERPGSAGRRPGSPDMGRERAARECLRQPPRRFRRRSLIMLTVALSLGLAAVAIGGFGLARWSDALESDLESSRVAGPYLGAAVLPAQPVEEGYGPSPLLTFIAAFVLSLAVAYAVARCLERFIARPLSPAAATVSGAPSAAGSSIRPTSSGRCAIDPPVDG